MKVLLTIVVGVATLAALFVALETSGAFDDGETTVHVGDALECTSPLDCDTEWEYCSSGVCVEKGSCFSAADCYNPENNFPGIDCLGPLSCTMGQCERTCSETDCPSDKPLVECLVSPCEVLSRSCNEKVASCVDDYCGGCNVYAFNEAGFQVCTADNTACESSSDCNGESEYCSSGVCVEMGVCTTDADCFNPENLYGVIECVGPISCMEGQCGRTCSDSMCPSDLPPVECLVSPCDVLNSTCGDEVASCVDNYCGGCNVYAFDEAGYQVCDRPASPAALACKSSSDCTGEYEYCSSGVCAEMGTCSSDADCFNPENFYAVIECVGPITCSKGQCGRTCSESFCPSDKPPTECRVSSCDTLNMTCDADVASCVEINCGGCIAYAFDEAGFRVCSEDEVGPKSTECESSSDCQEELEYCSSGICVEMGTCASDADCFNPENIYASIACLGYVSCSEGLCGRTCSDSLCPVDQPSVECLVSPCEVLNSTCDEEVASCVDNYCGGCNVYAFDEAGFSVCGSDPELNPSANGCKSSSDCTGDSEYCSSGVCVEMGVCASDADCFNPENVYPVIACVGPISCMEGLCGRTCSDSMCPSDQPPVECLVSPCEVLNGTCTEEVASCVDNYCGGCNAYAFDEGGFQVCTNDEVVISPSSSPSFTECKSSSDCNEESEFCSYGFCVEMGVCKSDADCFNPENMYPVIECLGPISCMEGHCGRTCGGSFCPADKPPVECLASPCEVLNSTCGEEVASCVDNYCGGCNVYAFDEAGFQVCTSKDDVDPLSNGCTSSSDCKGEMEYCSSGTCVEMGVCGSDVDCFNPDNIYAVIECVGPISCMEGLCGRTCGGFTECTSSSDCKGETEYCSSGVCVEMGVCSSDADCFNPENMYPVIECVGPISCSSGHCGRTCSASFCPSDQPPVECLASPCEVLSSTCDDKVASCVDNYCGGCNVYAFDEAGFQVCTEGSTNDVKTGAPCESVNDCSEGQYCSGGICLEDGFCQNDLDCRNPSNIYMLPACIGAIGCHKDGRCGIECGATSCPDGSPETNCLVSPCQTPPVCKEEWEYCIEDYCGGECGYFLLDAAGTEVNCTPL